MDELVMEHRKKEPSNYERLKVSIIIITELVKHYEDSKPFRSVKEISEATELPQHRINSIIEDLVQLNLVVTKEENNQMVYQPARDRDQLTIAFVIESLLGSDDAVVPDKVNYVNDLIASVARDLNSSKANIKLEEIGH